VKKYHFGTGAHKNTNTCQVVPFCSQIKGKTDGGDTRQRKCKAEVCVGGNKEGRVRKNNFI